MEGETKWTTKTKKNEERERESGSKKYNGKKSKYENRGRKSKVVI